MGFSVRTYAIFGVVIELDDITTPEGTNGDTEDYLDDVIREYNLELQSPGDCTWEESAYVVGYLDTRLFGWENPETLTEVSNRITSRMEEGRDRAAEMEATLQEVQKKLGLNPQPAQWWLVTNGG